MNFSQPFIERPIATSLLMGAIALFGTVAYQKLAVSDLPNVDFPTLLVTASLPGASPDTMAASVADAPGESVLQHRRHRVDDLHQLAGRHPDHAGIRPEPQHGRRRHRRAVGHHASVAAAAAGHAHAADLCPRESGRSAHPVSDADLQEVPLWTLDEYAETRIAQRISQVTGVAQVQVLGAQKYAVHVQMDPHALAARQIGINEVEAALKVWNVNLPTGADHRTAARRSPCRPPAS